MTEALPVYIVDDDVSLRNSLRFLLSNAGRRVVSFERGTDLLSDLSRIEPGPIILDVRLPGMDGLQVQAEISRRGCTMPIIVTTGHGDIPMAVRAMKAGAVDFLTKPFARDDLLAALKQAEDRISARDSECEQHIHALDRLNVLTAREFEVLNELARGLPNKSIGYDLGISSRTVEIHRAKAMLKLDVHSFPDLLRIAFAAGLPVDNPAREGAAKQPALPLDAEDESARPIKLPDAESPANR